MSKNDRSRFGAVALSLAILAGIPACSFQKTSAVTIVPVASSSVPAAGASVLQGVTLDVSSLSMNVGDYREFRADFSTAMEWEPLESSLLRCERLNRPGENCGYIRITALAAGSTTAGIRSGDKIASFPVQIRESSIKIDTQEEVRLTTGQSYGFVVSFPAGNTEPVVTAEGASLRQFSKDGLPQGSRYYEITALHGGNVRVSASLEEDLVAFPVTIEMSAMEQKAQGYQSDTGYLVLTDLTAQRVAVFKGEKENWRMEQAYPCSSGKKGTETPTGEYRVQTRGSWFFNRSLGEGAQWYVGFWGNYLFHSFPMDQQKKVLDSRLGLPLSHGCVRLRTEDAKWLYDNLPIGSKVVIY